MLERIILATLLSASSLFLGCASSSSDSGPGSCSDIAGTWAISGGCGADLCVITQSGCSTNFKCGGGTVAYTGSVNGAAVSYAGKTAGGSNGTCSGTLSGTTMSGTCSIDGVPGTCPFTATRK